MTTTKNDPPTNSTMANRRADRQAREAAGETPPLRTPHSFRAGVHAENPLLVVTHVSA